MLKEIIDGPDLKTPSIWLICHKWIINMQNAKISRIEIKKMEQARGLKFQLQLFTEWWDLAKIVQGNRWKLLSIF